VKNRPLDNTVVKVSNINGLHNWCSLYDNIMSF